jgi:hypothetical protein
MAKATKSIEPSRVGAKGMEKGACVEYIVMKSVGFSGCWKRRVSKIVFVGELTVIAVGLLIVSFDPLAGRKVALEIGTWV